jgi:hypothetical protein
VVEGFKATTSPYLSLRKSGVVYFDFFDFTAYFAAKLHMFRKPLLFLIHSDDRYGAIYFVDYSSARQNLERTFIPRKRALMFLFFVFV